MCACACVCVCVGVYVCVWGVACACVCVCACVRVCVCDMLPAFFSQILLNHARTDVNLKCDGGITPLMVAVMVMNQLFTEKLIKKNADITATDNEGKHCFVCENIT